MKKNLLSTTRLCICLLSAVCCLSSVSSQVPQSMNYQAVARNASGDALLNSSVAIRVSIRDGSATGTVVYAERDTATTNAFGLFTCKIGMGNVISGTFSSIDWAGADKYMQVELDPTGGSTYTDMGTSQLLSVPYALHAETSGDNNWQQSGNNIYNSNTGNVGIGTSTPGQSANSKFDVVGKVSFRTVNGNTDKFLIFDDFNGAHRIYTDNSVSTPGDLILGTYPYGHLNQLVLQQSTGHVGIGTATPSPSAALEINSTTGAVLLPRLTTAQRDALTPVAGMVIYNTDAQKFQGYAGGGSTTLYGNTTADPGGATCLGVSSELTFTPSASGSLASIQFYSFGAAGEVSSLTVNSAGCTPSSLGTSNIITASPGWNTWTFSPPVSLTVGNTYYITPSVSCLGICWALSGNDTTTGYVDPTASCAPFTNDIATEITVVSQSWVDLH